MLGYVLAIALAASEQTSHFVWPKQIFAIEPSELRAIPLAKAPEHFNVEGLTNEEAIDSARGVYVDLNVDGIRELIIDNGSGGSGGIGYSIYQRANGKWQLIGGMQGGITFCQRANGYYQIEVWSSGGGGSKARMLLRFQDARYHLIRLERYQNGRFIGTDDPKKFDYE